MPKEKKLDDLRPRSQVDEMAFQRGIRKSPWYAEFVRQYGEAPELTGSDYDYRGAWRVGVRPAPHEYDQGRYHWPSQFKAANHPTMWKDRFMRATGLDPDSPEGRPFVAEWLMYQ
jgi:hypothetical protein